MTPEHHYQIVELENGYLEATREDTAELQDFRINAYLKDGTLVKNGRFQYNIKYDYARIQLWKNGTLFVDEINKWENYGYYDFAGIEDDCFDPPKDEFEPVSPYGAYLFRAYGIAWYFYCTEIQAFTDINFYVHDQLCDSAKSYMTNILTRTETLTPDTACFRIHREKELEEIRTFNPSKARAKRIETIEENTQFFRCEFEQEPYQKRVLKKHPEILEFEVPLDSRFID